MKHVDISCFNRRALPYWGDRPSRSTDGTAKLLIPASGRLIIRRPSASVYLQPPGTIMQSGSQGAP